LVPYDQVSINERTSLEAYDNGNKVMATDYSVQRGRATLPFFFPTGGPISKYMIMP